MTEASTLDKMSPQLRKVMERARNETEGRFHSLAHLIDVPALERTYRRARKDAAVGIDGVTKDAYGKDLGGNLAGLHERMKSKRYRHQPIRRVHIPKGNGKTRPIGVSAFASSAESVGIVWLWQLAELVVECDFERFLAFEAIRFSRSDFRFAVEALDRTRRDAPFCSEPVEDEGAMGAQHPCDLLHGLELGAHRSGTPAVHELPSSVRRDVLPESLKILLQKVGTNCPQVVPKEVA